MKALLPLLLALAAYAARAGMEAHIFMPRDTPRANIIECEQMGAHVTLINGRDVRRYLLEKRYSELSNIVREDLQRYLTGLVEEHIDRSAHGAELELEKTRQLFYN